MDTSAADALARELNTQSKQHPRVSMLLVPNVEEQDGQLVLDLYWIDRKSPFCYDAIVPFADYADKPVDQAAKQILDKLTEDMGPQLKP